MGAYTNKLKYSLNYDLIDQKYIIVRVSSSEKMKPGILFLDSILDNNGIVSVCYTDKNEVFILIENDIRILSSFKDALSSNDDLSFKKVAVSDVKPYIMIQLFMNSLARSTIEDFSYNNLAGHLYIVDSKNSIKSQIKSLEIKIDSNCCLQANVRTFTSKKLERKIDFKKGKTFSSYPQYILDNNRYLKRVAKPEQNSYILRQVKGRKSDMIFLNFQSLEKFNQSKCGIVQDVMEMLQNRYNELLHIEFEEIDNPIIVEHKSSMVKTEKNRVLDLFKKTPVKVVDYVNNEVSKEFISILLEIFETEGIKVKQNKNLRPDCFNICIVHDKDYYLGTDDPHDKIEEYGLNQCLTIETYISVADKNTTKDLLNNIKNTIIHELLIKKDIEEKQISIFDWGSLNYSKQWNFIEKYKAGEEIRFCCMTIMPNGSFYFNDCDYNLFNEEKYTKYENAFSIDKNVIAIVEDSQGNINSIIDTNLFSMPNTSGIKQELLNKNNKLKNITKREKLLTAMIDINYYLNDDGVFYFSGVAQDKLVYTSHNSVPIRKIEPVNDSSLIFDSLLSLMNDTFIKNGQLTVIPFPFKYIREYVKRNLI